MSSKKKPVCISIDPKTWEIAKYKLGCSRSEWIENMLNIALNLHDEEAELIKKIQQNENENNILKDKLCQIRSEKKKELEKQETLKLPFENIDLIVSRYKVIGKDKIRYIANNYQVETETLENYCKEKNYEVINYQPVK